MGLPFSFLPSYRKRDEKHCLRGFSWLDKKHTQTGKKPTSPATIFLLIFHLDVYWGERGLSSELTLAERLKKAKEFMAFQVFSASRMISWTYGL